MKELWNQIERTVKASSLNGESKNNVLQELDNTIGSYLIERKYPIEKKGLTEREFIVYRDILTALNESTPPKVRNEKDYEKVVKQLFSKIGKPNSAEKKHILDMDDAYQNGNWAEVNRHLKKLWK